MDRLSQTGNFNLCNTEVVSVPLPSLLTIPQIVAKIKMRVNLLNETRKWKKSS